MKICGKLITQVYPQITVVTTCICQTGIKAGYSSTSLQSLHLGGEGRRIGLRSFYTSVGHTDTAFKNKKSLGELQGYK